MAAATATKSVEAVKAEAGVIKADDATALENFTSAPFVAEACNKPEPVTAEP